MQQWGRFASDLLSRYRGSQGRDILVVLSLGGSCPGILAVFQVLR